VPAGYESTYPYDPSGRMPGPDDSEIPDPLVWLSFLASATSTLKLATGVLILPQRNPMVLAKEVATIDMMSGGRMLLGVGSGWLEEEFDAIGVPFAERGRRTDENVAVLRALWEQDEASFDGEFHSFSNCIVSPKPAAGTVPIHVGGHTQVAARRAGRLGNGFFPAKGNHEQLAELFATARSTAEEHGRDPDAIEFTTGGNGVLGSGALAEVEALAELGVDRVIVPSFVFWGNPAEDLARYGEEVIAESQA
jgi:probable F420-dependent oxidoreductase